MTTLNRNTITAAYLFAAPAATQTAYLMIRTRSTFLALIVVLLSPMAANAVPITYSFSTGSTPLGDPTLVPLFGGFSVTGTFDYDSDTPATTIIPSGPVAGSTLYLNSTANLVGSVGAWSFSDPIGRTIVGNNKFQGSLDILNLIADPNLDSGALPSAFGLDGFDVDGFSLINVRMFWIQGQLGITDFLSNQDLPNPLPDFQGRLALDFTPTNNPGERFFVFFDGLRVEQVPEPGTLALLGIGLAGMGWSRRKRKI